MKHIVAIIAIFLLCTTSVYAEDYANTDNWAYFGIGEGKDADLFLIAPTVDMRDEYNMSMVDEKTKADFLGALNMERGIYEDHTRMYAPYYRQMAMKGYELDSEDREQYLEIAYSDVSDAFAWYLDHENKGRPLILAGFSQGADMCYRLLEEFDDLPLVAVYALGWPNTTHIMPAEGETDIGVVVSFDCEAPDVKGTFIIPKGTKAVSINPLNWKTDSTPADKTENKGACFTDYSGEIVKEIPELCGCYIDEKRGTLKVTDVDVKDYPAMISLFPEGAYHIYDYQFFFRNLQENVGKRTEAYLQQTAEDKVA